MENRLCCKNCKYRKAIKIDGLTSNYCKMFIDVFKRYMLYTIKDVDNCKCEMFEEIESDE